MAQFTPVHYYSAFAEAGEWARTFTDELVPPRVVADGFRWAGVDSAVYIAIDEEGEVSYVGSVCRVNSQGLRGRISEHLRSSRGRTWRFISIVPLRSGTPLSQVRLLEGRIARILEPHSTFRIPVDRQNLLAGRT